MRDGGRLVEQQWIRRRRSDPYYLYLTLLKVTLLFCYKTSLIDFGRRVRTTPSACDPRAAVHAVLQRLSALVRAR